MAKPCFCSSYSLVAGRSPAFFVFAPQIVSFPSASASQPHAREGRGVPSLCLFLAPAAAKEREDGQAVGGGRGERGGGGGGGIRGRGEVRQETLCSRVVVVVVVVVVSH